MVVCFSLVELSLGSERVVGSPFDTAECSHVHLEQHSMYDDVT
jgi:hypothetical protein